MNDELTYKSSGVDVEAGDRLVDRIKPFAARTKREGSIGSLGGFGGFFEIPGHYRQPVLVSGTDGVGTKLKLAFEMDRHDSVGIDLVAMCANDILAQGAEPLFFLDYLATSRLDVDRAAAVIAGIAEGCERAGAALIGGETAEMPGMYSPGEYDLAGFCVGVVEKDRIIDGSRVGAGDTLVGLPSTGVHSNGFSLLRKLIEKTAVSLTDDFDGASLGERLLEPTAIYVRPMLGAMERFEVHGVAHITGGGITGNVVRILGPGLKAVIDDRAWPTAAVFDWIESAGVKRQEMLRTFNCGLGMVLAVAAEQAGELVEYLGRQQQPACIVGRVEASTGSPAVHVA